MKQLTKSFFDKAFEESILEYSKHRFISEEEIQELIETFSNVLDKKILREQFDDAGRISLILHNIW
jgi:hypothetical protein